MRLWVRFPSPRRFIILVRVPWWVALLWALVAVEIWIFAVTFWMLVQGVYLLAKFVAGGIGSAHERNDATVSAASRPTTLDTTTPSAIETPRAPTTGEHAPRTPETRGTFQWNGSRWERV